MTLQVLDNCQTNLPDGGATATGRATSTHGPSAGRRRALVALALLAIPLMAQPAAAQEDCDSYPDWTDIGWFRSCADERGEDWATEMLGGGELVGGAALHADNPAIIQVLLQAGADPHRVDDEGRTSLTGGKCQPGVAHTFLAAGADPKRWTMRAPPRCITQRADWRAVLCAA